MYRALSTGMIGIRADFEQQVALARQGGFEGVEFDLREVTRLGAERAQAILSEAGVRAGGCGIPVNYRAEEEEYQKQLGELPRLAEVAKAIGCERMFTWLLPGSDTHPFQENFTFHISRLRPVAEVLAEKGCRFGLEFVGPRTSREGSRYDFIYSMDGMLALCAAIGTQNLGLLLDCWHWYTAGGSVKEISKLSDADIVYVHLNDAPAGIPVEKQIDNIRRLPGETGVIDLAGFLGALAGIGYTGPVVVEPFSERLQSLPPEKALRETAASLAKVWNW